MRNELDNQSTLSKGIRENMMPGRSSESPGSGTSGLATSSQILPTAESFFPITDIMNPAWFGRLMQRPRLLIQDKITISEAPWGIHKHNCNSSRTVWENGKKMNETLVGISVPGTGAFPDLLAVPAASEFRPYRSAQESAGGSCLVRSSQLFRRTARKNEIKDLV
jgi:hypothetical protein